MMNSTATVPTVSGSKYLQQLCKHWSHKLEVELVDRHAIVRFPTATATMTAAAEDLIVRIDAEDEATLERMEGVLATHLDRFAFREAPLPFAWHRG
jgi:hypothetical protein